MAERNTLQGHFDHLTDMFARRNAFYISGGKRTPFLLAAVKRVNKMARADVVHEKEFENALASLFARAWAFAEQFRDLPVVRALAEKYSQTHCGYCFQNPCECQLEKRSAVTLADPSLNQLHWSLSDWCNHFQSLYGLVNEARGIAVCCSRLAEEVSEAVVSPFYDQNDRRKTLEEARGDLALEMADVFAWICAMANLTGVDLEKAIIEYYPDTHVRCGSSPCTCGAHHFFALGELPLKR